MAQKILKGNQNNARLLSIRNGDTQKVLNKPDDVTAHVHDRFQQQARPAFGNKTNKYLPEEAQRDYPWCRSGALDPFTLETKAGKPGLEPIPLLDRIRDPHMYQRRLHKLPNRKSPGPDGIPNELLKHLPEEMHKVIHKMFIIMWMTGCMPKAWKESCTILIHKKGDVQERRCTGIGQLEAHCTS